MIPRAVPGCVLCLSSLSDGPRRSFPPPSCSTGFCLLSLPLAAPFVAVCQPKTKSSFGTLLCWTVKAIAIVAGLHSLYVYPMREILPPAPLADRCPSNSIFTEACAYSYSPPYNKRWKTFTIFSCGTKCPLRVREPVRTCRTQKPTTVCACSTKREG